MIQKQPLQYATLALWAILQCSFGVFAQPATLPYPKLLLISPQGGRIGTTVRVTLTGADLEEANALCFSHASLQAQRVPDPKNPKVFLANVFDVTIASNAPLGLHDVRVMGKYGISNPRAFAVGELAEASETEPNNDISQAQKVSLNTTINGTISSNVDVDYFSLHGPKGTRVTIVCEAESIDSRLDPELRIFTSGNKLLTTNRRYHGRRAVADVLIPDNGACVIRICEYAHRTGDAFHGYRLSVTTCPWVETAYPPVLERAKISEIQLFGRNFPLAANEPQTLQNGNSLQTKTVTLAPPDVTQNQQQFQFSEEALPHQANLDGFEWRLQSTYGVSNPVLLSYAAGTVLLEKEDNDLPEKAQLLPGVCEICGRIDKAGDRDWFIFQAQANEVFILEGYADRLGSPVDLFFIIRRADNKQILGEIDDHPEATSSMRFYARTEDPKVRFVAPAAGRYEIMVSSREAAQSYGPRHIYCLSLRREQPDFRLVVMDNHQQNPGAPTIWRGGSQYLEVTVFRRDGYSGPITLTAENLPQGVTCPPQVLGPGVTQGVLVLQATKDATLGNACITIKGVGVHNGQNIVREARGACSLWANPNETGGIPASTRLTRQIYLAVQDATPFSLDLAGIGNPSGEVICPLGGSAQLKLKVNRLWPGVATPITVHGLGLPPNAVFNVNNQPITIASNQTEATITINAPANVPPGAYSLSLMGQSAIPFNKDAKNAQKPAVQVREATLPITMHVINRLAHVYVFSNSVMMKTGGTVEVLVRAERLYNFKGPFNVQLVLPPGLTGIIAKEVIIPEGNSEVRFVISASAQAVPTTLSAVAVRVTGTINGITLSSDYPISITLMK